MQRTLFLTLKKVYFDQIAAGEKTTELREFKPFFEIKFSKQYDQVLFQNGYRSDAPRILVEIKKIEIESAFWESKNRFEKTYVIYLGKILEITNYDGNKESSGKKENRRHAKILKKNNGGSLCVNS